MHTPFSQIAGGAQSADDTAYERPVPFAVQLAPGAAAVRHVPLVASFEGMLHVPFPEQVVNPPLTRRQGCPGVASSIAAHVPWALQ